MPQQIRFKMLKTETKRMLQEMCPFHWNKAEVFLFLHIICKDTIPSGEKLQKNVTRK